MAYAFFFLKREKRIIFSSTNNKHFIFNSKNFFVEQKLNFESQGFKVFFVINDPIKRAQLNKQFPDSIISNKGIKNKLFILESAVWIISTLDLPVSGVFLARKRFVYHLGHGVPIKNIGLMEEKCTLIKYLYYKINTTNISLFLSPSSFFKSYMANAFGVNEDKIIVAPQPRMDTLFSSSSNLNSHRDNESTKLILYCPTWRPFANTRLFPFEGSDLNEINTFLIEQNTKILLRLHPLFEGDLTVYDKSNIVIFDSKVCAEVSDVLVDIDALITDYSSIYCDYFLLDRPVAFIPYDLPKYKEKIGFSFDYKKLTSDCYLDTVYALKQYIVEVSKGDFDVSKQNEMKSRFNYITDQSAGIFNYELILEKFRELS